MTTKQILRLAYGVVALALLAWAAIGWAIWSAWRSHQEESAAVAAGAATTVMVTPYVPAAEAFDRSLSSVQYRLVTVDAAGAAGDDDLPAWLTRTIDELPVGEQAIGGWIGHLRKQGVAACWRMAAPNPREAEPVFAMPFEKGSVQEILSEMCRRDTRFRWEWMKGSQVVNVLADEGLDVPLGDVSFRPKRLYYCLSDLQPTVYVLTSYPYDEPRNYQNLLYWPVAIKAKEITVRDYLNLSVSQYEGMTWTVNSQGALEFAAPEATRAKVIDNHRDVLEAETEQ